MKLEKTNFFWDGAHSKFDECSFGFWSLKKWSFGGWFYKKNLALIKYIKFKKVSVLSIKLNIISSNYQKFREKKTKNLR